MIRMLSERTLVPISLVIMVMGGVVWLTRLHASVEELKTKQDVILGIKDDISVIKVKVDSLWNQKEEEKNGRHYR